MPARDGSWGGGKRPSNADLKLGKGQDKSRLVRVHGSWSILSEQYREVWCGVSSEGCVQLLQFQQAL